MGTMPFEYWLNRRIESGAATTRLYEHPQGFYVLIFNEAVESGMQYKLLPTGAVSRAMPSDLKGLTPLDDVEYRLTYNVERNTFSVEWERTATAGDNHTINTGDGVVIKYGQTPIEYVPNTRIYVSAPPESGAITLTVREDGDNKHVGWQVAIYRNQPLYYVGNDLFIYAHRNLYLEVLTRKEVCEWYCAGDLGFVASEFEWECDCE